MSDVVGIFVGGHGRRMGGVAKGLLTTPDGRTTLVARLWGEARAALPEAEIVLVGDAAQYEALGLRAVADTPPGVGPLGGLCGLLLDAEASGAARALALACDLPRLERGLIARLAREHEDAAAVVVTEQGVRNPLIASYEPRSARTAAQRVLSSGKRSLQALLDELSPRVATLILSESEQATLVDWDAPEDARRY